MEAVTDALFPAGRTGAQTGRALGPARPTSVHYWLKFIFIIISLIARVEGIQTSRDGASLDYPVSRDCQVPHASDLSQEVGRRDKNPVGWEREKDMCRF